MPHNVHWSNANQMLLEKRRAYCLYNKNKNSKEKTLLICKIASISSIFYLYSMNLFFFCFSFTYFYNLYIFLNSNCANIASYLHFIVYTVYTFNSLSKCLFVVFKHWDVSWERTFMCTKKKLQINFLLVFCMKNIEFFTRFLFMTIKIW